MVPTMMLWTLLFACAPADPAGVPSPGGEDPTRADTAGWWLEEPGAAEVPEGPSCAQAELAEAQQPVLLAPTDGEASRYSLLWLAPEGDEDALRVEVSDGLFDLFDVEAFVYVAASDLDVAIELRWVADPDGGSRRGRVGR